MTNFEKIKQMSVEEMFEFLKQYSSKLLCDFCIYAGKYQGCYDKGKGCEYGKRKWLESEAE